MSQREHDANATVPTTAVLLQRHATLANERPTRGTMTLSFPSPSHSSGTVFERISASITLNRKLFDRYSSEKEGGRGEREARREQSRTWKKLRIVLPNATRFKVSFFQGDAVGTVRIRGLRNFQYGKQYSLSEWGCLCELWQICVIASSSVSFSEQSSLLIQGMSSYSENFLNDPFDFIL